MCKIIFVCHGSICRSPAAEMIFRKKIRERGLESRFEATSLALSDEELGNDIYPPMKRCLLRHGIEMIRHSSRKLRQSDLDACDYLFFMDSSNRRILSYLVDDSEDKCRLISCFTSSVDEIEDPWYTGNFDKVVNDISKCVDDIITALTR